MRRYTALFLIICLSLFLVGCDLFGDWFGDDEPKEVTYSGNDLTDGFAPVDPNRYEEGDQITVLDNTGDMRRHGYYFDGWNTVSDGSGTDYQPGDTLIQGKDEITFFPVWTRYRITDVAAGWAFSMVVRDDGSLWSMGDNWWGQLGRDDVTSGYSDVPIHVMDDVDEVETGYQFAVILQDDGDLFTTGANHNGQLGIDDDDAVTNIDIPQQIIAEHDIVKIAAGYYHTMCIDSDGVLYAWGDNSKGQLGINNGAVTKVDSPTSILNLPSSRQAADISLGTYHSLVLTTDGYLYSVGFNSQGQLGNGNTADQGAWNEIDTDVTMIEAGGYRSYYVKDNGDGTFTNYAMGDNTNGRLGDGTTIDKASPVAIMADIVLDDIECGTDHTLFLEDNGDLYFCGLNSSGQFGNGNISGEAVPTSTICDVSLITGGGSHTLYTNVDDKLFATGDNSSGQLGTGDRIATTSPEAIDVYE